MNLRDGVFHGLAIKRAATTEAVAHLSGHPAAIVAAALDAAVATGRAVQTPAGYSLTPLAKVALEARYGLHYAHLRADVTFMTAYERFERINIDLKQIITDWQTVPVRGERVVNDHADADYDARVIDRLGDLHDQAEPVLTALAQAESRIGRYLTALTRALEQAEDGDTAWVSDVRRESYHTVWFELHEDLLRIAGRVRID